ncbi:MAG TPA: hypothetical protein VMZ91_13585 [Candidatus Paceibacterota bacterium]|nr:hypothetical protein [Candidatus Paceibacterota bacterium]
MTHEEMIEVLENISIDYLPGEKCECDACNELRPKYQALQYFIGIGEVYPELIGALKYIDECQRHLWQDDIKEKVDKALTKADAILTFLKGGK